MRTKLMEEVEKLRRQSAEKWSKYFADGNPETPEVLQRIKEENEDIRKLADKATREWLKQKTNTEE